MDISYYYDRLAELKAKKDKSAEDIEEIEYILEVIEEYANS